VRTKCYGDKRDVVKWATLINLCTEHKLRTIIQVPLLKNDDEPVASLRINGQLHELPQTVWSHFRDLNDIKRLGESANVDISIIPGQFRHDDRDAYMTDVCLRLDECATARKVVFLDPDTGIEPKKANERHVKVSEIRLVWRHLKQGDWLVLYQHALRNKDWRKECERRLVEACGGAEIKTSECDIAHDVAFFCAERGL